MSKPKPDRIELTDARALRAYAHPLRMRLVGLLRREGPLTATQAAQALGESSGSTSFHLRQLAKYGLVEEAGGGTGRQKPWRATALFTEIPASDSSPEFAEANTRLRATIAKQYHQQVLNWIARRPTEPRRWQRAAPFNDYMLYLTAAELERLGAQLDELIMPFVERTADPSLRPKASRLVTLLTLGLPAPSGTDRHH